ncbi:centrosome-associated zinc finger protein CP190-like isoform X2 [Pseudomyrmex gracilis]|nr:centrosome-associated zinc finger protein CP190-like isoform X2 [Pseudomyrmex gracilis]
MPLDMSYECVKPIIRFMYTGQLEYWSSEQDDLYCTAQKMDMTVLTKLLDLELTSDSQITDIEKSCSTQQIIDVQESSPFAKPISSIDLPLSSSKQLLEEKSDKNPPIWKRKLDAPLINSEARLVSTSIHNSEVTTSGPSRFDFPEANSALEIFSSFDNIRYDMKPFHQVSNVHGNKSYIRKCSLDKKSKNNMIQKNVEKEKSKKNLTDTNLGNESISKNVQQSQDKPSEKTYSRVSPEEKENIKKLKLDLQPNNEDSVNNHANIVKEVLKKYPHLAKNNSNIRVKIMQKKANSSDSKTCTKTSYVLFKSEYLLRNNNNDENLNRDDDNNDNSEKGPWKCNKCNFDKEYTNYDMFRRHMYDVHEKKYLLSEKTCQYCDYKTKKQDYMICHLYNEHKIPLPEDVSFYKCHVCSYVAVRELPLLSHMMKYNHRPTAKSHAPSSEEIQHSIRNESLKDESSTSNSHITKYHHQPSTAQHHTPSSEENQQELFESELSTHKPSNKHKSATDREKLKFHRCKYCGESFRQLFNFSVHLDCVHKKMLKDKTKIIVSTSPTPSDKSLTAEVFSNDTKISVPAESKKNAHQIQHTLVVKDTHDTYILPDMELDMLQHNMKSNKMEDEPIILMVSSDNQIENYQEQSDIIDNTQIIMQDTNSSMIVYAAKEADHQSYQNYQPVQVTPDFEEVEEVVEEVEEFMEEEKIITKVPESSISENCIDNRIQEVIQYVEEQTEIVEYTNEKQQCLKQNTDMDLGQESVIILKNMSRKRP